MATATSRSSPSRMTDPRLLSLLHFADSAFPTGGYAHSFGLETYCQGGLVRAARTSSAFFSGDDRGLRRALRRDGGRERAEGCRARRPPGLPGRGRDARGDEAGEGVSGSQPADGATDAPGGGGADRRELGSSICRAMSTRRSRPVITPSPMVSPRRRSAGSPKRRRPRISTRPRRSWSARRSGSSPWDRWKVSGSLWGLHPVIERVAREAAARDAADLWSFAPGIEIAGIRHATLEMRLFRS